MERIRGLGEERGGKRDLEEEEGKEMDFLLYGDGGGEEEKKNVELRSEEAAILFGQTGQLLLRDWLLWDHHSPVYIIILY